MNNFKEDLDFLTNDLVTLVGQFNLFKDLFASGPERVNLMNQTTPVVFARLQRALLADIVVSILRLGGSAITGRGKSSKENLVLKSLLIADNYSKSDFEKFDCEGYADALSALDDALKPIKDLRNKSIAHNDVSAARNISEAPEIKLDELTLAIELMKGALRIPHQTVNGCVFIFDPREPLKNSRLLLDLLRIGRHIKDVEDTAESKIESYPYERCYPKTPDWL